MAGQARAPLIDGRGVKRLLWGHLPPSLPPSLPAFLSQCRGRSGQVARSIALSRFASLAPCQLPTTIKPIRLEESKRADISTCAMPSRESKNLSWCPLFVCSPVCPSFDLPPISDSPSLALPPPGQRREGVPSAVCVSLHRT